MWSRESANAKMDGEANTALFAALSEHGDPNAQKGAIASTRASAMWSLDSANVLQASLVITARMTARRGALDWAANNLVFVRMEANATRQPVNAHAQPVGQADIARTDV